MKPIIVIPTYNESHNIEELIREIFSLNVPELELIIVDDNSPDGTGNIVEQLAADFPIHIIKRNRKLGLGSAYVKGFKKALALGADAIFEMDADFSHNPKDVPRLLEALQSADLAIGSRRVPGGKIMGWNWRRHLTSWGATVFSKVLLRLKTKDTTAGFRCYRRKVLETLALDEIRSNGYAFQEEMLYKTERAGWRVAEVPVTFADRSRGKSKLSGKDAREFFGVMLKLRFLK